MSEDFKKFNQEMMQNKPQDGTSAPVADNTKAEQLPPPPSEINVDMDDVEKPAEPQPKVTTSDNGTYHGIFLAPMNQLERLTKVLTEMAETDQELALAIAVGKKTFEGCDRFIKNNMKDLMREMHAQEVTFDDESVHRIARWYMVNPDAVDVQPKDIVKATKKEPKPKAEKKPKTEKNSKVIPITPQMGALFSEEDFD